MSREINMNTDKLAYEVAANWVHLILLDHVQCPDTTKDDDLCIQYTVKAVAQSFEEPLESDEVKPYADRVLAEAIKCLKLHPEGDPPVEEVEAWFWAEWHKVKAK